MSITLTSSIFLSYSSIDVEIGGKIENHLQKNQVSVWQDKSNIRDDWSKEIVNALSKSDIVLVIW